MKNIMEKVNTNVLIATLGAVALMLVGSATILSINGSSADQITLVLGSIVGSISSLVVTVATLSKVHGIKDDTTKVLNGTMDAKIVNGVKAALIDLGIVHTTAAPLTAETAATHVVETLANKPTPDGGTQVP